MQYNLLLHMQQKVVKGDTVLKVHSPSPGGGKTGRGGDPRTLGPEAARRGYFFPRRASSFW
jgi:hypothetical protein